MGKLIAKVTVMLIIVIGASNYFIYIKTGKTPLSNLPKFSFDAVSVKRDALNGILPDKKDQAYKWTDADGTVHYSSEAPPREGLAELIEIDPNTNLIQGLKPKKDMAKDDAATNPSERKTPTLPSGAVYNPETIRKLIDDAKGVQDLMNKRTAELESIE